MLGFLGIWVGPIGAGFYSPAGRNSAVAVSGRDAIKRQRWATTRPREAHATASKACCHDLAFDHAGRFTAIGEPVQRIRQSAYTSIAGDLQGPGDHEPALEGSPSHFYSCELVGGCGGGRGSAG